jgi:hypothetical protein
MEGVRHVMTSIANRPGAAEASQPREQEELKT